MSLVLGNYSVFGKIVDTALGNTGGESDLDNKGTVSANSGEITPMKISYMYTVEIDAEATANPKSERAKLSILYQY